MRKFFTVISILLGVIASAYFLACNNNKSEPQANAQEDSVKQVLARGEYLAIHVVPCLDCHSKRDFTKFSGPLVPGTEGMGGEKFDHELFDAMPGTVYARNITPDPETGIGTWTDDEVLRAITQGINKNGDTLFPLMPYATLNHMPKSDLLSIIAYIRTLKPIKNKVPERQLMIPISMAYPGPALQPSVDANVAPPESDPVKYGEYMVNLAGCNDCHTPYLKGQPDFSNALAGGSTFNLASFKVTSANITPDSATGIGTWTEDRFLNKFLPYREEKGYNFDPGKENTIMPLTFYAGMKDSDLKAIYAYLHSIKPVSNKVEKYPK
ncbi:MAG: cytochrome C [Bacteroidia bacterium]|nr:cytochrome C [Bacteroidia bacterium]